MVFMYEVHSLSSADLEILYDFIGYVNVRHELEDAIAKENIKERSERKRNVSERDVRPVVCHNGKKGWTVEADVN